MGLEAFRRQHDAAQTVKRVSGWRATLGVLLVCVGAACHRAPVADEAPVQSRTGRFPLSGTVLSIDGPNARVTIGHDAIKDLMPAMAMPFKVVSVRTDVHPGDRVAATLVVTTDASWLEDLVVTKAGSLAVAPPPSDAPAPAIGAVVPDFRLRNQDGQPIHLAQFKGRVLMVTFIYTQCPLPDFCPLMMKNFDSVRRAMAATPELAKRVHLLSISIDPARDTPEVLHRYGTTMIKGADRFDQWDLATGTPEEVRRMAGYFGVTYAAEDGQISHTLGTAIIGVDGRVVATYPDNSWLVADAVAAVTREAKRAGVQ